MPNPISKLFGVFLATLLLFIWPTYQSYKHQNDLAYQNTFVAVTDFVDNVRMKGYVTPAMYEDFYSKLSVGDILYTVEMVHQKKVYHPVYTDPTNPATFTGEYVVYYDEYFEDELLEHLFSESSLIPKQERMYKMSVGDTFSLYIENKTKTKATMLFDYLTGGLGGNDVVISIPYGGMVLNEDY